MRCADQPTSRSVRVGTQPDECESVCIDLLFDVSSECRQCQPGVPSHKRNRILSAIQAMSLRLAQAWACARQLPTVRHQVWHPDVQRCVAGGAVARVLTSAEALSRLSFSARRRPGTMWYRISGASPIAAAPPRNCPRTTAHSPAVGGGPHSPVDATITTGGLARSRRPRNPALRCARRVFK